MDQKHTQRLSLLQAFKQFFVHVKPNCFQFTQICFMTFLIGAIVATCKTTQALMTGKDEDKDGKVDDDEGEFIVDSKLQSTQYLIAFGISKAFANLFVGITSDIFGRKIMFIIGWIFALVIPFMVIFGDDWNVVVASNVFLGISQGITWTLAIVFMIDYAGVKNRAFTIGINETIGYSAVAIFGVVSTAMVDDDKKNYREAPYYMILGFIILSIIMAIFTVKENKQQVEEENKKVALANIENLKQISQQKNKEQVKTQQPKQIENVEAVTAPVIINQEDIQYEKNNKNPKQENNTTDEVSDNGEESEKKLLSKEFATARIVWPDQTENKHSVFRIAFVYSSFLNTNLMCCNLMGLMINFLTAFAWGIFTKWLKTYGGEDWEIYSKEATANIILFYAIPKGVCQFFFGFFSDRYGRKIFVTVGMIFNIIALIIIAFAGKYSDDKDSLQVIFSIGAFILGFGTSIMYPNVLAASTENTLPITRASALGTYRFWRDSGYWVGGLFLGAVADIADIPLTIGITTIIVFLVLLVWIIFYNDDNRSVNQQIKLETVQNKNLQQQELQQIPVQQN